jgi:uncharacterized iron-regulated protein
MKYPTMRNPAAVLVLLSALAASSALAAPEEDRSLHLPIGDPARRDREAPLVLDGITDARTGDLLTPADLPARLAGARLILVGESHTNADFHLAQLRVIQELQRSGRQVLIGLEMFPEAEQRWLDAWTDGSLTEEGFLRLARWYRNWGYNWGYYRDLFLFARDQRLRMFALNAPREVVSAVGRKGLAGLTPEERSRIAASIDTASDEHRTLIRSFFGEDDPLHSNMPKEQLDRMYEAQCTWDATMGHNAVKVLEEHGGPGAALVVLVGSGHVAYGLGIQRQVAGTFEGGTMSVIPVPVRNEDGKAVETVRASYADFLWGVPKEGDPLYPSLGLSTATGDGEASLNVIFVSEKTPAERAGFKTGDVLLTMDGAPLADREALNRAMAGKRWGDAAVITVRRGGETATLTVAFRR